MENTLKEAVKKAFGRNYSKPIIARLKTKRIKPVNNDCFTEKIIQDIVNGRSNNLKAEKEIIKLLCEIKTTKEILKAILENKLTD